MSQSGFPFRSASDLDPELVKYLDRLGRVAAAISELEQLASTATSAQIAAKVNEIISAAGTR